MQRILTAHCVIALTVVLIAAMTPRSDAQCTLPPLAEANAAEYSGASHAGRSNAQSATQKSAAGSANTRAEAKGASREIRCTTMLEYYRSLDNSEWEAYSLRRDRLPWQADKNISTGSMGPGEARTISTPFLWGSATLVLEPAQGFWRIVNSSPRPLFIDISCADPGGLPSYVALAPGEVKEISRTTLTRLSWSGMICRIRAMNEK